MTVGGSVYSVINLEESFWTIPAHLWKDLYVSVRWKDFPPPTNPVEWMGDADWVNIEELVNQGTDSLIGFRSQSVGKTNHQHSHRYVSPIWLDLDLYDNTQTNLDTLLARVVANVKSDGWRYRGYRSGEGYHVELDPDSKGAWAYSPEMARDVVRCVRSAVYGDGLLNTGTNVAIDVVGSKMLRMVGSANRKGGIKEQIDL
jgi:hypothetical protein